MTSRSQYLSGTFAALAVVAATACLTSDTLAMAGKPLRTPKAVEQRLHLGPEAMLVGVLKSIAENRIAAAHEQLDKLLEVNPNFRLAQLIKGDLLQARSRPITTMGDAPGAPLDRIADLRDEAKARIQRVQAPTPNDRIPRNLLKLSPEQKFAIVVDTARSTLFVYENREGTPRYLADYYITIGKNGIEKAREGDKRTPVGVYHVTANLPRAKLTDFYGSGAFPISYPNEWDKRNGRNGHGIWLHGTPRDTYSRPPRASDGCVVLTNDDLLAVSKYLQVGVTPVIITHEVDWVSDREWTTARADLEAAVELWRKDWESLKTDQYLAHYAPQFSSGEGGLAAWAAQKRQVNASKDWVKVKLDDLSLFLYPGAEPMAVTTFVQDYRSNNLSNVMKKRLYWIRDGQRWKIIQEGSA